MARPTTVCDYTQQLRPTFDAFDSCISETHDQGSEELWSSTGTVSAQLLYHRLRRPTDCRQLAVVVVVDEDDARGDTLRQLHDPLEIARATSTLARMRSVVTGVLPCTDGRWRRITQDLHSLRHPPMGTIC